MSPTMFRAIGITLVVLILALLFVVSESESIGTSAQPVNAQEPQPMSSDDKEMKSLKIE